MEKNNWKRMLLMMALGLTVMAVVLTIYWKRSNGGEAGDGDSSVASLIPIWTAAFIPLIASRKKGKSEMTEGKKNLMIGLLIGVVLLVLITIYLMFV